MKTKPRRIYLQAAATLALVLAISSGCKKKDDVGSIVTISTEFPELRVVPAEIDKITVTNGSRLETKFEKRDGHWMVIAPPPAGPANAETVEAMLQNLAEIKVTEMLSASSSPEDLTRYELTPDKAIHVVVSRGGSAVADLSFGKSSARGQTVQVGGNKAVWSAKGYSSYLYSQDIKMWRDSEELRAYKAQEAAKGAAEEAKCSKWTTICTLGRFPDGSERTTGTQSYPTKAACEEAGKAFNIPCDPCKCR